MGCRGIHIAISPEEREALLAPADDDERVDYVQRLIDERYDTPFAQETDKAWDDIHRCLGEFPPDAEYFYPVEADEGTFALPEDHGTYPLKLCVLGGRKILAREYDYIIRMIDPDDVAAVAEALKPLDADWFLERYQRYCGDELSELDDEEVGYALGWFAELQQYFARMAGNGRSVVFFVDQ